MTAERILKKVWQVFFHPCIAFLAGAVGPLALTAVLLLWIVWWAPVRWLIIAQSALLISAGIIVLVLSGWQLLLPGLQETRSLRGKIAHFVSFLILGGWATYFVYLNGLAFLNHLEN